MVKGVRSLHHYLHTLDHGHEAQAVGIGVGNYGEDDVHGLTVERRQVGAHTRGSTLGALEHDLVGMLGHLVARGGEELIGGVGNTLVGGDVIEGGAVVKAAGLPGLAAVDRPHVVCHTALGDGPARQGQLAVREGHVVVGNLVQGPTRACAAGVVGAVAVALTVDEVDHGRVAHVGHVVARCGINEILGVVGFGLIGSLTAARGEIQGVGDAAALVDLAYAFLLEVGDLLQAVGQAYVPDIDVLILGGGDVEHVEADVKGGVGAAGIRLKGGKILLGQVCNEVMPLTVGGDASHVEAVTCVSPRVGGADEEFELCGLGVGLGNAALDDEIVTRGGHIRVLEGGEEGLALAVVVAVDADVALILGQLRAVDAVSLGLGSKLDALGVHVDLQTAILLTALLGPACKGLVGHDLEGAAVGAVHAEAEGVGVSAVAIVVYGVAVVVVSVALLVGGGGGVDRQLHPLAAHLLVDGGSGQRVEAVHANSLVIGAARNGELGALAVLGLDLGNEHAVHGLAVLHRQLDALEAGVLADGLHILVVGGGVEAPGGDDHADGHGVALLQGDLAQIQRQTVLGILTHGHESRIAGLAADGEFRIVDHEAQIHVVMDEGGIGGVQIVHGEVGMIRTQLEDLGVGGAVDRLLDDLILVVQISHLAVTARIALQGVEGEILGEVGEGYVLQHLVADLVVGTQLVGLGKLQVVVGDLDAAVDGNVIHLHVGVDGARGDDIVVEVLGGGVVAVLVGVLQEVLVAAVGMLRLVAVAAALGKLKPVGHGQRTEIGEGPEILRTVEGIDAAGLGGAQGQMVVGPEELDGGELLQGQKSPVHVEIQHRQLSLAPRLDRHGEVGLGVGGIAGIEYGLLVLTLEVLVDHGGNGQEHTVLVQDHGVLAAAARGVGVDVDGAVGAVALHRHVGGVVAVPFGEEGIVEACAADAELVRTAEGVIAKIIFAADRGEGLALVLGLSPEGGKIVGIIGVDAAAHVEIVGGGVGVGRHLAVLGAGGLGDGVDAVLEGHLQLTAVLVGQEDEAQNTNALDVKAHVLAGGEVGVPKGGVRPLGILDGQLGHGIGGDGGHRTHALDALHGLAGYEVQHLVHLVGVGVEGAIQENGGSVGLQVHGLDLLDLHVIAKITDVEAQGGDDIGVIGNRVDDHGVGVPFVVTDQLEAG